MTEQPFEVETVGAYQGATLHTNRHTFIFWTTPSDHHLGVILSADSNWYFAKCRIETGLLKDLEEAI